MTERKKCSFEGEDLLTDLCADDLRDGYMSDAYLRVMRMIFGIDNGVNEKV